MRLLLGCIVCWMLGTSSGLAFDLTTEKVTENVYALVGEIGPRSYYNHALSNTLGFVVGDQAVLLVGSGATPSGARLIEQAVASVTPLPIRWVVNIGSQDHHWMGNSYFADKGAQIIALQRTVQSQQLHQDDHLLRLRQVLRERADEFSPRYADPAIGSDRSSLNLAGHSIQLIWPGKGHFDGDAILWLPDQRVVFTGDLVYHDRMLGVQSLTDVQGWRDSFHAMAALSPRYVIPGHGYSGDLARAYRDTGDYLDWLVLNVSQALEEWRDISQTVDGLSEVAAFRHLQFYDSWHRLNINRSYLQLEASR